MYSNDERFITETVEAMLPRFSDQKLALVMKINLRWNYYSENGENDTSFSKTFLVVFHRPSNYTKVLLKEIDHTFYHNDNKFIDMELKSDHDSCWRSDGMRWIYQTYSEAWDYFDELGIDGRKLNAHVGYAITGSPKYYLVDLKVDRENHTAKVKFENGIPLSEVHNYIPKGN